MNIDLLHHVAINIVDLDVSIAFYRDVLGLEEIERPDFDFPGAWFRLGTDQELHLIGRSVDPINVVPSERHMAFRVKDIAATQAELKEKGVDFNGPKHRPDGVPQIFLVDPDGHVIELTQTESLG